ncbi:MAG: tRNA (uridine(34)/cytosine(34)/5-carboxymethylaminomethyluridine(34)-2'-O)-methyltransferase TrmL [Clostridia bacterium]|nr:tRNA (uridine(34)/cytosine(34)/5-carboxymethylaminomethyluridine(34)-2'-O)-methyltransferase TrmL [Clostridia bacterium]
MFNIVLVEPEIPANTGNIARTCAVTNSKLHLIRPLGFSIDDKHLKRAGLDYWDLLNVQIYECLDDFFQKNPQGNFYFATTKAKNYYTEITYRPGDYFLFGKETKGLPLHLLEQNPEKCIRIPMLKNDHARSLNLSNSVAVVVYEAFRQNNFSGLI